MPIGVRGLRRRGVPAKTTPRTTQPIQVRSLDEVKRDRKATLAPATATADGDDDRLRLDSGGGEGEEKSTPPPSAAAGGVKGQVLDKRAAAAVDTDEDDDWVPSASMAGGDTADATKVTTGVHKSESGAAKSPRGERDGIDVARLKDLSEGSGKRGKTPKASPSCSEGAIRAPGSAAKPAPPSALKRAGRGGQADRHRTTEKHVTMATPHSVKTASELHDSPDADMPAIDAPSAGRGRSAGKLRATKRNNSARRSARRGHSDRLVTSHEADFELVGRSQHHQPEADLLFEDVNVPMPAEGSAGATSLARPVFRSEPVLTPSFVERTLMSAVAAAKRATGGLSAFGRAMCPSRSTDSLLSRDESGCAGMSLSMAVTRAKCPLRDIAWHTRLHRVAAVLADDTIEVFDVMPKFQLAEALNREFGVRNTGAANVRALVAAGLLHSKARLAGDVDFAPASGIVDDSGPSGPRPSLRSGVVTLVHEMQQDAAAAEWQPLAGGTLAVACRRGVCLWRATPPEKDGKSASGSTVSGGDSRGWSAAHSETRAIGYASGESGGAWMNFLPWPTFGPVRSLSWSPCGRFLAASSPDSDCVVVWDVATRAPTTLSYMFGGGTTIVRWSPCGSFLFGATASRFFHVWETTGWSYAENCELEAPVRSASWAADGRVLAIAVEGSPSLAFVRVNRDYTSPHLASAVVRVQLRASRFSVAGDLAEYFGESARRWNNGGVGIREVAWDPTGERVAISFERTAVAGRPRGKRRRSETGTSGGGDHDEDDSDDEVPDQAIEAIALYSVRPSLSVEFSLRGVVQGSAGSGLPSLLRFSKCFGSGALLTACYENGLMRWWPLLFSSAAMDRHADFDAHGPIRRLAARSLLDSRSRSAARSKPFASRSSTGAGETLIATASPAGPAPPPPPALDRQRSRLTVGSPTPATTMTPPPLLTRRESLIASARAGEASSDSPSAARGRLGDISSQLGAANAFRDGAMRVLNPDLKLSPLLTDFGDPAIRAEITASPPVAEQLACTRVFVSGTLRRHIATPALALVPKDAKATDADAAVLKFVQRTSCYVPYSCMAGDTEMVLQDGTSLSGSRRKAVSQAQQQKAGLLAPAERRLLRFTCLASVNRVFATGGYPDVVAPAEPLDLPHEVIVMTATAPRFDCGSLDAVDFVVSDKVQGDRLEPPTGDASYELLFAAFADQGSDGGLINGCFLPVRVSKKRVVFVDLAAYAKAMEEAIDLWLGAFDLMVEDTNSRRAAMGESPKYGMLKATPVGLCGLESALDGRVDLTPHLAPIQMEAWKRVLEANEEDRFPNIKCIEFPTWSCWDSFFKPQWIPEGGKEFHGMFVFCSEDAGLLEFGRDEQSRLALGILMPTSRFNLPGNGPHYDSFEAAVANNTDVRFTQSYLENLHLLEEACLVEAQPVDVAEGVDGK